MQDFSPIQFKPQWWFKWQGNNNCKAFELQCKLKYESKLNTRQLKKTILYFVNARFLFNRI